MNIKKRTAKNNKKRIQKRTNKRITKRTNKRITKKTYKGGLGRLLPWLGIPDNFQPAGFGWIGSKH